MKLQPLSRVERVRKERISGVTGLRTSFVFDKMRNMITVTITLGDDDRRFIEAAMKSGRYVTESEAIADGLAELRAREEVRAAHLGELRAKVIEGLAQLDRGESDEWNVADIKNKGRTLLAGRPVAA